MALGVLLAAEGRPDAQHAEADRAASPRVFKKRRLDDEALEELEEVLISADLGTEVGAAGDREASAARASARRSRTRRSSRRWPRRSPRSWSRWRSRCGSIRRSKPHVVLVVGVNGTGKTTTIGKLAQAISRAGACAPVLVAGDTFRAAAVEQLQIWGERTGAPVIAGARRTPMPAGLAFDALTRAQRRGADVLLIDTAGRLHNKAVLMDELRKIIRVLRKQDATAPHSVLLVLDATTGQNAIQQVRVFKEMVDVTGLVVTKLDGSARGGIVVALAETFGLPVHAVGVGEKADDLRPFDAVDFARGLVGADVA